MADGFFETGAACNHSCYNCSYLCKGAKPALTTDCPFWHRESTEWAKETGGAVGKGGGKR